MGFSLIPKEEKFYGDFVAMADELRVGARLLEAMMAPERALWEKADAIKEVEHKCDFITHEIMQRLNRTFVTPIDREDIHALAGSLDDVMDAIDTAGGLLRRYRLETMRYGARELAAVITAGTEQLHKAFTALEQGKPVNEFVVEVNRLENEADRIHHEAVARLFDEEKDPILIMKWKETIDFLEQATDLCEDVSNVLEGIVVKHG